MTFKGIYVVKGISSL